MGKINKYKSKTKKVSKFPIKTLIIISVIFLILISTMVYAVINKKPDNINVGPITGLDSMLNTNSKQIDLVIATDYEDPVKLAQVKSQLIQFDAACKEKGIDLLVNGVHVNELDLTRVGDKNGPPMKVPVN